MRIKFPAIIRVMAGMLAVAAFVIPAHIGSPASVSADPGIMRWDTVITPGFVPLKYDILNDHFPVGSDNPKGSEILSMSAGNDGKTVDAVVRTWNATTLSYNNDLFYTKNSGISWTNNSLSPVNGLGGNVFQVVSAAGDPMTIVATIGYGANGPKVVVDSTDGGMTWNSVFNGTGLDPNETIRCIDVSKSLSSGPDIAFGTAGGAIGGRWMVRSSNNFSSTVVQMNPDGSLDALGAHTTAGIDYMAIKFSPTYDGDSSVALVYSSITATYYNVAFRDINQETTLQYAFTNPGIEVKNPASAAGASPGMDQLNNADLQLPSDFSGQSSSLRRAYISLDALGSKPAAGCEDGIYRIDDTTTYVLMDTSANPNKAIYSIAYYGTYASGKLLAGERMGFPCTATVPTWFTDSPTTCPIPCWYPALKPTTGGADQGTCSTGSNNGFGAALVDWNADGSLGYAATGSLPATVYAGVAGLQNGLPVITFLGQVNWYQMQYWDATSNDESAFAISRNNGETWNQLALIDTTIDWFNDVAVAPDCTTIYLASVNINTGTGCNEFDSVWRATINPNVAAPLPVLPPLGTYWERVLCRVTSGNCLVPQSELPILRVVESCTDKKDGEIVAWAAQNARATIAANSGGVMAWSPDYGDYWASITPRYPVQDFTFESSTTMYVVSADGVVQRLPYTGTSWSTNLPNYDTQLLFAHTIAAVPDGQVLVGGAVNSPYPASYSLDKAVTFNVTADPIPAHGNEHVIFDVDYANNQFIYMADDAADGSHGTIYRNTIPSLGKWVDNDLMSAANGNAYVFAQTGVLPNGLEWPAWTSHNPPHIVGQFGIVQAFTGNPQPALYSAHAGINNSSSPDAGHLYNDSAVCRTLKPRDGMPKPGIRWSCLDVFVPLNQVGVYFTLEPTSLKACGCCTLDTNTSLYAIDNERYGVLGDLAGRWNNHLNDLPGDAWNAHPGYTPTMNQGMLWGFTDCLAKKGPVLKSPADQYLVGADPVSGRNQQIDLAWEQLCLSTWYQLQIAKDKDFTLRINPSQNWSSSGGPSVIHAVTGSILLEMDSTNNTSPAAWIPPGALPEAGAIYYWRMRSARSATSQIADSPWSEVRSFTVKAGFIVNTPYYGVQLLNPSNGGIGIATKPTQFSWSPWQDATKYEFDLAKDSEFKQMVTTANTTTTAYSYPNALDYNAVYFWRVKALEVNGQNIPSDWSAAFSFTTEKVPVIPAPPVEPAVPAWVWVLMALFSILAVVILFFIMRTRRD